MVRKAVIALALLPVSAFAQSSTTNCQKDYFGNVTCQTNQTPSIDWSRAQQPQPNVGEAFNKGFREGQERRRQQERDDLLREAISRQQSAAPPAALPFPPPVSTSGKYGITAERKSYLDLMIQHCRTGAPLKDVPTDQQMITGALCYAFDQGRIDEITRSK